MVCFNTIKYQIQTSEHIFCRVLGLSKYSLFPHQYDLCLLVEQVTTRCKCWLGYHVVLDGTRVTLVIGMIKEPGNLFTDGLQSRTINHN